MEWSLHEGGWNVSSRSENKSGSNEIVIGVEHSFVKLGGHVCRILTVARSLFFLLLVTSPHFVLIPPPTFSG